MEKQNPTFIIAGWLGEFSKNQLPINDRVGNFCALIDEFRRHHYVFEDFFEDGPLWRLIVSNSLNTNHPAVKRAIWQRMVEKDLAIAIAKIFEEEIRKNQIKATEESAKKLEETKAPAQSNDISNKEPEEFKPELPPPPKNPLDRSLFKDEPDAHVIFDDNFEGLSDE